MGTLPFSGIAQGCCWKPATIISTFLLLANFTCAHSTNKHVLHMDTQPWWDHFCDLILHLHFCSIRIPTVLVKHEWWQLIRAPRTIEEIRSYDSYSGSAVIQFIDTFILHWLQGAAMTIYLIFPMMVEI